jgi:3-isopropylmalate/(R)-2-methylmalate dehydratase small subunit
MNAFVNGVAIRGRARILPDNINTDYIISSRRKRVSIDPDVLKQYLLEDYLNGFSDTVMDGDILVAGKNFGCGSAMEVAVTVVLAAGIPCVLAKSFSRSYYRNAINNGLLPLICDTGSISEGDTLGITGKDGSLSIENVTRGHTIPTASLSPMIAAILQAGGLTAYLLAHGDFPAAADQTSR